VSSLAPDQLAPSDTSVGSGRVVWLAGKRDDSGRPLQIGPVTMTGTASESVSIQHERALSVMPFADTADEDDARRGFIASLEPGIVRNAALAMAARVLVPPAVDKAFARIVAYKLKQRARGR
jgi:hypothetical protein